MGRAAKDRPQCYQLPVVGCYCSSPGSIIESWSLVGHMISILFIPLFDSNGYGLQLSSVSCEQSGVYNVLDVFLENIVLPFLFLYPAASNVV